MLLPFFACLAALSPASVQREVQQKWCFFRGEISNSLPNLNSTLDFRERLRLGYVGVDPDLETSVSLPRHPYLQRDGLSSLALSLCGWEGSLVQSPALLNLLYLAEEGTCLSQGSSFQVLAGYPILEYWYSNYQNLFTGLLISQRKRLIYFP